MSMRNLTGHFNTKATPQSEAIPGREAEMKPNSAGGVTFTVDKWSRLQRFLILGSDGGTYYISEKKLTQENATVVLDCLAEDGKRVVDLISVISDEGRAPKNTPALFALALACKLGNEETKALAYKALPKVARTGTHLFEWTEAIKAFGGHSHGWQRAVKRWYIDRRPGDMALQIVKYQSRNGWSHRDVLRLAKPSGFEKESEVGRIFGWAVGKWAPGEVALGDATDLIWAFEKAKAIGLSGDGKVTKDGTKAIVNLITDFRLPREAIPTHYLNEVDVWAALLDNGGYGMPMTAMIRNLPKMTAIGLLQQTGDATKRVVDALGNEDALRKARVHPLSVLVAMRTYASGHGVLGSLSWTAVRKIVDGLDGAFYKSFKAIEPTNKRWMLALDVSGSMSAGIAGMPGINCREVSAAMAMVTAASESESHIIGFTSAGTGHFHTGGKNQWSGTAYGGSSHGVSEIDISPRRRLDDNVKAISGLPFGGTDCSLPMIYARERGIKTDVFVVYTDSETWAGNIAPRQALAEYRNKMGIDAKLIVVGMAANGFTIADPKDKGMLDVVGMDTSVPAIMSQFALGNV